ncbi:hypothetical protein [Halopiger djelfimassiliensis]|uniref:hypothetical protein n=1 Tax=Halopiger djelfimassiliensis TaxID=1293047 RepID=UPI000677FE1F|nr:hypothetical protein [Halopiger djelfimassiliensis]
MQHALRTTYERYGPGTDRRDIGAGYAAVIAAVVATTLYVATVVLIDSGHLPVDRSVYFMALERRWVLYFATRGQLFVVPAAFLVGTVGWRLLPARTSGAGFVVGGLGTISTYLVGFVLLAVTMVATKDLSTSIGATVELSGLAVLVGFALTWWATIPVGCLTGLVYVTLRSRK